MNYPYWNFWRQMKNASQFCRAFRTLNLVSYVTNTRIELWHNGQNSTHPWKHYIGPSPPPEEPEIQELRVLPESAEHNLLGKKYIYVLKTFFCCSPRSLINSNEERTTNWVLFPRHKGPRSLFWPRGNWCKGKTGNSMNCATKTENHKIIKN